MSHFPNIEALEFRLLNYCPSDSIANMEKLQKLSLEFKIEDFSEFLPILENLATRNSLKSLELSGYLRFAIVTDYFRDEDTIASVLCKMTNLKELKLDILMYSLERHLPQIGQNLRNLQKFCYKPMQRYRTREIDLNNILPKILRFVYEAEKLTHLILDLDLLQHDQVQYFYDNLVSIRRSQTANAVLYVNFFSSSSAVKSPGEEEYVQIL